MPLWSTDFVPPTPRLAVDHAGSGPFVIFLHGNGGNRTFWHDQLAVCAPHFHAAAWDARGYGASDDYDGPLAFSQFADDLARVLDHFKVAKAHVVGLSMGGRIAMDFCIRNPDRVATLVLASTSLGFDHIPAEKRAEFLRLRKAPLMEGKVPADIAPTAARALMRKSAPETVYQRLHDGLAALHKESYLKTLDANVDAPPLALERIRVPTHVIVGDLDTLSPPDLSRAIAARINGASLTIIPDAGHISNVEQPEAFNRAMLDFLLRYRVA